MATSTLDPNKLTEHDDPQDLYSQPSSQDEINDLYIDKGIQDLQKHANTGAPDKGAQQERETLKKNDDLYEGPSEPSKGGLRERLRNKRKGIIGGGVAIAAVGGGLGAFMFFSQPFQILQFAKTLQAAHALRNVEFTDSRGFLLLKYALTMNAREKRNLGFLGNHFADKYTADLKAAGLEPDYTDPDGRSRRSIQGFNIDTNTPEGQQALRNMRAAGLTSADINVLDNGRVRIDLRGKGSTKKAKLVIKGAISAIGKHGVAEKVARRIMIHRARADLSPLRNRTREANEDHQDLRRRIRDEDNERIRSGADPNRRTTTGSDEDQDGVNEPDTDNAANESNDLLDEIADADSPDAQRSLTRRLLGGGAAFALAGAMCAINDIGNSVDGFEQEQNDIMIRKAQFMESMGSQSQSFRNFNVEELGIHTDDLYDETAPEGEKSVYSAKSVQAAMGNAQTGPDIPAGSRPATPGEKRLIFQVVGAIPFIDQSCGASDKLISKVPILKKGLDMFGQGILTVLGGAIRASGITDKSPEELLLDFVRFLAEGGVNTLAVGAELGNILMYGMRLITNDQAFAMGGRYLSDPESSEVEQYYAQFETERFQTQSLATRLFSPYETKSLLAKTVLQNPSFATPKTGYTSLLKSPLVVLSNIGTSMKTIALPSAYAQQGDPYNYGFNLVGYSVEELELIARDAEKHDKDGSDESLENPYANADVMEANNGEKLRKANSKWGKCFSVTVNPDTGDYITKATTSYETAIKSECQSTDIDFLRYRLYLADKQIALAYSCYNNIADSCETLGFGATLTNTKGREVAAGTCDPRTKDLGPVDGYEGGAKRSIRVCAIPNLPSSGKESTPGNEHYIEGADNKAIVHSDISKNTYDMVEAAKVQGVTMMAGSTFRTMGHQQDLYNCYQSGSCAVAAQPGFSNHQMGLAIDFNISVCPTTIAGACAAPGEPMWDWLNRNGSKFGFSQYSGEAWHWSTTGN